ncbi:hypothetical protein D9758_018513 [Tetrapyrgos nigripes]|uniref:HAT C-terminal dimerisation domain-containing protein n=1 Tax=Tetrapyrgos nigripes TaxID=182062 RepID=A0A8H5FDB7_9AGAR|nr:hypothetical protein D9758_018513 [Tetrapyrgos nigripes]
MYCSNNKKKKPSPLPLSMAPRPEPPVPQHLQTTDKKRKACFTCCVKALKPPKAGELGDELDRYLSTDVEATDDVLGWWYGRKKDFPTLYRMGLDYLTIPATSTDVERVFSRGRFLLPYVRNRLSADTTRALMCLRQWSLMGLIQDEDVMTVAKLPEIEVSD